MQLNVIGWGLGSAASFDGLALEQMVIKLKKKKTSAVMVEEAVMWLLHWKYLVHFIQ